MVNKRLQTAIKLSPAFSALRHHNYRLWFFGQMISLMGTWMQSVAQGWLVYEISGSSLALGSIAFLGTLPTLFLMLPAGAIADRVPKQRILLVTQSVMMLCAFVLTYLAAVGMVQVWHIATLAVILGIAQSFDAPCRQSMTVEMVEDRQDLASAIALNSMMFNMARIVGPAVGGLILATLGAVWCFGINGATFLAVLAALALMRFPTSPKPAKRLQLITEIKVGVSFAWHNTSVRSIIIVAGSAAMFGMTYSVLLPAIAADVLHVGEAGLGYLATSVGVGALAGSVTLASLGSRVRKGLLLTVGNLCLPIGLLLFAFSSTLPLAMVSLVLVGWAWITQNATANTLVQLLVPDEIRGRVMALYMLVLFGSGPFNSALAGILGQAIGAGPAIAIGAVVTLIFGIAVAFGSPSLRRTR